MAKWCLMSPNLVTLSTQSEHLFLCSSEFCHFAKKEGFIQRAPVGYLLICFPFFYFKKFNISNTENLKFYNFQVSESSMHF